MSELRAGGRNAAGPTQGCFSVRKDFALCPEVSTNPINLYFPSIGASAGKIHGLSAKGP